MDSNGEAKQSAVMMIEIGMTRQPRAYQSVRVGVTLPVFVTPEDDVQRLLEDRLAEAKFALEEEVDREFESYGEPAPYSKEPRYMLALISQMKLGAIVPVMETEKLPGGWRHARTEAKGHRFGYVKEEAAKEWSEYGIIDASDGDLGLLPAVEYYTLYTNSQAGFAVLTTNETKFDWREMDYPGYFGSTNYPSRPADYLARATELAQKEKVTLFDCTDGDFSRLPVPPEPEPEPEDDDYNNEFEDDDGHGDDED